VAAALGGLKTFCHREHREFVPIKKIKGGFQPPFFCLG